MLTRKAVPPIRGLTENKRREFDRPQTERKFQFVPTLRDRTARIRHIGQWRKHVFRVGWVRRRIHHRVTGRRVTGVVDQAAKQRFTQKIQITTWQPLRVVFDVIDLSPSKDGEGRIIWGDELMVLLSRSILETRPGSTIIAEVCMTPSTAACMDSPSVDRRKRFDGTKVPLHRLSREQWERRERKREYSVAVLKLRNSPAPTSVPAAQGACTPKLLRKTSY